MEETINVPMLEILNDEFMSRNTPFKSFEEFMLAGGFDVNSNEEFDALDESELNSFVSSNTKFLSFSEMASTAGEEYFSNQFI